MIQITPQMRILVAVEAVDGRRGIDSLAQLCQEQARTCFLGRRFFRSMACSVDQLAQGEKVIAQHCLAGPHHGGVIEGSRDGRHDQDQRDHHHHLEKREAVAAGIILGV